MTTCFVVQGFGKKTDFTDGRVLDLDASYAIIKAAVEAAGLDCLRADEIAHSGTIDLPMYQHLLQADLVIADLSTYNVNAAFELGIRYGLRPRATIIVAEDGFKNPFDVGHLVIRRYKHLGEDIGAKEARRFGDDLAQAIGAILATGEIDSPVYTFLPELKPPQAPPAATAVAPASAGSARAFGSVVFDAPASAKALLEQALTLLQASDFGAAVDLLREVRQQRPNDSFVIQQLAMATYKSAQPNAETALDDARTILQALNPATTNDPETLGLWGAIHKKRWEIKHQADDLNESIDAYGRGFQLKQDYYNGINLAFLLDLRALGQLQSGERGEAITDSTLARRTRREVIKYAEALLAGDLSDDQRYWILATLCEAATALGSAEKAEHWAAQASALKRPAWMVASSQSQLAAVLAVQAKIASFGSAEAGAGLCQTSKQS